MKLISIIDSMPTFTQVSILYTLLGSLNSSAINSAARQVTNDLNTLDNATTASRNGFSIDKYNELLNELRSKQLSDQSRHDQGYDTFEGEELESSNDRDDDDEKVKLNYLQLVLTMRAPLMAMFHAAQAKLPNRDGTPPDFSFEESLARQLAREYSVQAAADEATDQALIDSGACTVEELEEADRARFDKDQDFKDEFKHLILDKLRDAEPYTVSLEQADEAFSKMGEETQHRMVRRLLPKLMEGKRNNITRRSFDPDASTNILLLGYAITEFKNFLGDSEADAKLKKLMELQAA